jgi:peptidoglycan/LPS O-acetylase OafA/YrhL
VLSGFVLARGALGKTISYAQFLRNRVLRIFPLMVFVLVFVVYGNTNVTLSGIVAPFLLLSNTSPRLFTDITDLSGTVWTIAVEFQFYLIAPFVFIFVAQRGGRYLASLMFMAWIAKCIVLFAHRGSATDLYTISYYTIVGHLNQFLVGVGVAYFWPEIESRAKKNSQLSWTIFMTGIASAFVIAYVVNGGGGDRGWKNWMVIYPEVEALSWAAVMVGYVLIKPLSRFESASKLATAVGLISFSVYILHWSIEQIFWKLVAGLHLVPSAPNLWVLIGYSIIPLLAVLLLSSLSYITIEQPFLDMRRRYIQAPADIEELPRDAA